MTFFKTSACILLTSACLMAATQAANARAYYLQISTASGKGYSSKSECERNPTRGRGCKIAIHGRFCHGNPIYASKGVAEMMAHVYGQKKSITVRYLNANGSAGRVVCSFN